jgi:xanthine dehydrogenase YagS FAD-binding subunit
LAGNLCQRPRCWYFRGSLFRDCYRKGGGHCYAPEGENQYHAVFGADSCHMVYPSDLAPALIASGAKIEIAGPKGHRTVPLEQFYLTPKEDILRENSLKPGEMVVAVELPPAVPSTVGVYLKLKEREAFDFALVSVAFSAVVAGGAISQCRVVFGGLAPFPLRATKVETVLRGKTLKDAAAAAGKVAAAEAKPLSKNAYKVDAAVGVLEKALGALA